MAYYDFTNNAHGAPSAKRIARSTVMQVTTTINKLAVGDIDSDYVSASNGLITFTKNCKILLHYELAGTAGSTWVKMTLYKNNVALGDGTMTANSGTYLNGSFVLDMSSGDEIYGSSSVYDSAGGSIAHYTIYVLTEE